MALSQVVRRHGIPTSQLLYFRRRLGNDALVAIRPKECVVPERQVCKLEAKIQRLERIFGQKTVDTEKLKRTVRFGSEKKNLG